MKTELFTFMNLIAREGGAVEEGVEMIETVLEFASLVLALIAFYFAGPIYRLW